MNKDLNIYVLIKQVPDTKSKAGVNADGTIDRAKAGKMLNPFDAFAMQAAIDAKAMGGPNSKITAVTMGPPPAVEILYQALEHGIDKTCILSDRKLAASDTLATAYALSQTLAYLQKKDGPADLVFCGLQTTDGDTAQVGPEICERMDLTQITYCEGFEIKNDTRHPTKQGFASNVDTQETGTMQSMCSENEINERSKTTMHARKVIEGGAMEVEADLPALITIANSYNRLEHKTFRGAKFVQELKRNENLAKEFVEMIDLATCEADDARCGLPGSPTIVSATWKIGTVGGSCIMHQGKSVEELVGEVVKTNQETIKEFAKA